jgi:hypothetical protein
MTTVFDWANRWPIPQAALQELLAILDPVRPALVPTGKATSEAAVQAELQVEAARRGGSLWRNNSGACIDQEGRQVRYGLANTSAKINAHFKSSDLIGITPVTITHDSVGRVVGIFTAIEVKEPGWKGPRSDREKAQNNFLTAVRAMGGIGKFAQSTGDVYAA